MHEASHRVCSPRSIMLHSPAMTMSVYCRSYSAVNNSIELDIFISDGDEWKYIKIIKIQFGIYGWRWAAFTRLNASQLRGMPRSGRKSGRCASEWAQGGNGPGTGKLIRRRHRQKAHSRPAGWRYPLGGGAGGQKAAWRASTTIRTSGRAML